MVRLALRPVILVATCAAALAGCGGGDEGSAGPLDNALGYLPEDAPLVVAFETDPEGDQAKAAQAIVERFPFGDQLTQSLEESLSRNKLSFEDDIKPLLGNEFVVGVPDVRSLVDSGDESATDDQFVAAIEAKDRGKLEDLIKRDDTKQTGEQDGAKLYEDGDGDTFAIEDGVLIVAGTRELLDTALKQRDSAGMLTAEVLEEATADLPEDALVRLSTDVGQLVAADPETEQARKVEWVSALRDLGLTISVEEDLAKLDLRLATDPEGLTEEDLPIAAGGESPAVIDSPDEIGVGVRAPEQILAFAETAGQAVDPSGFGDYSAGKQAIESRLGVSIDDDIFGQLEDDVSVSFGLDGKFGLRARVKDPQAFTATLDKLGKALPEIAENAVGEPVGYAPPKKGGDFYALATADGDTVVYGVVDGMFVLANDSERASRLAEDETKAVEGAEGSIAMSADAQQLVSQGVSRFGGSGLGGALGGSLFSEPLGAFTGSVGADPGGLSGRLVLTFD
ncbi:MAG: DUF3352 domain-containing protein [Thermoleophilaceae bacterium]|nr:DUF3352 domain-containing protein [Thermoleophilaceae bacterium]